MRILEMFAWVALTFFPPIISNAQQPLVVKVSAQNTKTPLEGATVTLKGTALSYITGKDGICLLTDLNDAISLAITHVGYQPKMHILTNTLRPDTLFIFLAPETNVIEEVVVSTGYYELDKSLATGSFDLISNDVLNRTVSTDIISRLESNTTSLLFDRRGAAASGDSPELTIRGLGTIHSSSSPLVIVDNFPYEGDISNLNPNDVESITMLKDASAASIWGARAGNGVIVITTKKGRYDEKRSITFNHNVKVYQKPDLGYDEHFIPSASYIELEKTLFERGHYTENDWTPLSPVVELLIANRDGRIDDSSFENRIHQLSNSDIREQASDLLYRSRVDQQHSLSFSGGSSLQNYMLSFGYDNNINHVVGSDFQRVTINAANSFKFSSFEVSTSAYFTNSRSNENGFGLNSPVLRQSGRSQPLPYISLLDELGIRQPITKDVRSLYAEGAEEIGLLNWQFVPLDERDLMDYQSGTNEIRLFLNPVYELLQGLKVDVKYQYQKQGLETKNHVSKERYEVRSLVNSFTQADGSMVFPYGGILTSRNDQTVSHSLRLQTNYMLVKNNHQLRALAGWELRSVDRITTGHELYDYDHDLFTWNNQFNFQERYPTRPRGTNARLPLPSTLLSGVYGRYVSTFSNAIYSFKDKYIFSASARWDASNLFGVKTNQKGTPLWSAGANWLLSDEEFYQLDWLQPLTIKMSYGFNGNTHGNVSAAPTAIYRTDRLTGLRAASIRTPGNPMLRWEKVGIQNFGIDFGMFDGRIAGTLEYYIKDGRDLLGNVITDITSGWDSRASSYLINDAHIRTRGLDISVSSVNVEGPVKWRTNVLFSYAKDRVMKYSNSSSNIASFTSGLGIPAVVGKSRNTLFSYPWIGLDHTSGNPLVVMDGQPSDNYRDYLNNLEIGDLVEHGLSLAPIFGSIRNTITWKNIEATINFSWKADYYFRKQSVNYYNLINSGEGHKDYDARWIKPGDELTTSVPSMPEVVNQARDNVYGYSEALVEKADHIRINDIGISYSLGNRHFGKINIRNLRLYLIMSNLGTVWKSYKGSIDPDYPHVDFLPPRNAAFGLNMNF